MGFQDAELGPRGADGGLDVIFVDAVAQVKAQASKTGRPDVQALYGVATHEEKTPLFFSLGGYTDETLEWASAAGVAAFTFNLAGEPEMANPLARDLLQKAEAGATTEPLDLVGRDLEWTDIKIALRRITVAYRTVAPTPVSLSAVSTDHEGVVWQVGYAARWAFIGLKRQPGAERSVLDELEFNLSTGSRAELEFSQEALREIEREMAPHKEKFIAMEMPFVEYDRRMGAVHKLWREKLEPLYAQPLRIERVTGENYTSILRVVERIKSLITDGGYQLPDFEITVVGVSDERVGLVDWLTSNEPTLGGTRA